MARNAANRARVDSIAQSTAALAASSARAYINNQTNNVESESDQYAVAASLQQSIVDATATFTAQTTKSTNYTLNTPTISVTRNFNTLTATVNYSGTTNTTLSQIIGQKTMTFHGTVVQTAQLAEASNPSGSPYILQESFESLPSAMQKVTWGTYLNYNGWVTLGGNWSNGTNPGLEIGTIHATYNIPSVPDGSNVAELDSNGNSSMSKHVYLTVGNYELRYWYFNRVTNSNYTPAWICGSNYSEVTWATAPDDWFNHVLTNQVSVYFDYDSSGNAQNTAPPATYWDSTLNRNRFDPSKNNLLDSCVESGNKWIERSVTMTVYQSGYYWLTFQAEGASDTYGGIIDNIRLCSNTCPGTVQENFPWAAGTVLFQDDFNTTYIPPQSSGWGAYFGMYAGNFGSWINGSLDKSGTAYGWSQAQPWVTSPYNQMDLTTQFYTPGGSASIEMNASVGSRSISRQFVLDPGYYQVSYNYASRALIGELGSTPVCGKSPAAVNASNYSNAFNGLSYTALNASWAASHYSAGTIAAPTNVYYSGLSGWGRYDENQLSMYVDNGLQVSHPVGSPLFYGPSTYANPDGSAETLPELPQNVLDTCLYSSFWTNRAVQFKITKPGIYWLTWRSEGQGGNWGSQLANINLTALGSLTGPNYSSAVTIPAPTPAIGTTINFGSFSMAEH